MSAPWQLNPSLPPPGQAAYAAAPPQEGRQRRRPVHSIALQQGLADPTWELMS